MELRVGEKKWSVSDDVRPSLTAWLTINRACNLRCVWCYAKMTEFKGGDMTLETAEKSIALLKELGLKSVILIGGEPTVHPHFLQIVEMVRLAGMEAFLVTNAVKLANTAYLEKILKAGVSSVTVSFKAADQETFLHDTGRDLFRASVQAVRNIVRSGVNHVVNITACENLMRDFDTMIEAVKSTGTDKFSIDTGKPVFQDGKSSMEGMSDPREIAKFFMVTYPKLETSGLRFSVKVAVPFCLFPRKFVEKMIGDGNILTGCQMSDARGIVIDPAGNLLPCNHLCDLSLGEIGQDFSTAQEFLDYRKSHEMAQFYQTVSTYPHESCATCHYWVMCGAGCRLYWLH